MVTRENSGNLPSSEFVRSCHQQTFIEIWRKFKVILQFDCIIAQHKPYQYCNMTLNSHQTSMYVCGESSQNQTLLSFNVVTVACSRSFPDRTEYNYYESIKKQNSGWKKRLVDFKEYFHWKE